MKLTFLTESVTVEVILFFLTLKLFLPALIRGIYDGMSLVNERGSDT